MINGTKILGEWARKSALEVSYLWEPSETVIEYLKTGNPDLKEEVLQEAVRKIKPQGSFPVLMAVRSTEKCVVGEGWIDNAGNPVSQNNLYLWAVDYAVEAANWGVVGEDWKEKHKMQLYTPLAHLVLRECGILNRFTI